MSGGMLLIDGYNLLHAAGMAQREYKPGDLLRCRTRLLRFLLGKLSAAEIRGTTIVFDARDPPPDRPAQVVVSGLKVLFANPHGDADVLIQEWLSRQASPRRVTLVSSDRVLQRAARGCRAKFVDSDEFLNELSRRREPRGSAHSTTARSKHADDTKPAAHLSASQTAYWLRIFGDAPVIIAADAMSAEDAAPQPSAPAQSASPAGRAASPARKSPSRESRPVKKSAPDEADYWRQVFGELSTESIKASPDELRLADLENWLKEFQARENP
jgi:hypothetical protein